MCYHAVPVLQLVLVQVLVLLLLLLYCRAVAGPHATAAAAAM